MRHIIIYNHSAALSANDLERFVEAIQAQLDEDFAPLWGLSATIEGQTVPASYPVKDLPAECIHIVDHGNMPGVAGFHQLNAAGVPEGYVFLDEAAGDLDSLSETLDHEVLEQVADPHGREGYTAILPASFGHYAGRLALIAKEVCDAVEDSSYERRGVALSNFVLPAWFMPDVPAPGGKWDFNDVLTAALTTAVGGYFSLNLGLRGWMDVGARRRPTRQKSRYARRRLIGHA